MQIGTQEPGSQLQKPRGLPSGFLTPSALAFPHRTLSNTWETDRKEASHIFSPRFLPAPGQTVTQ